MNFSRFVLAAALLCMSGLASAETSLPALERVTVVAQPKAIADFELTDQNGKKRTFSSLRGAPTLVFFGFTRCPDVCPAALTKLKLMQSADKGSLKAARVVLISVDGERDTPSEMKKYLAALSPEFIGLTGDSRTVGNIAARFSAVAFKEQADARGNYGYYHSTQIFLLDRSGRLRASFFDASVDDMAQITKLVMEEK